MPPVSRESFALLFRDLGPAERTAFVADLWAERGWEPHVDGVVVAERDGTRERIRVVDPGRFGTPTLDDVDVLVSARNRSAVGEAAEAANVTYLPPDAVRERLLYGMDRDVAAALFEATFDQPLGDVDPPQPLQERARETVTAVGGAVSQPFGRSPRFGALVLVLLVVGLAVAGPALTPEPSPTTTSTTTFESGATDVPPATVTATTTDAADGRPAGLGEQSITELSALIRGHVDAVVGTSRTLHVYARGPPNATFMRGRMVSNYTVRIESAQQYRFEGRYVLPPTRFDPTNESGVDLVNESIYAGGEREYRREVVENDTNYWEYAVNTTGNASTYTFDIQVSLRAYLQGEQSTVECAGTRTFGECIAYRVVVTGAPSFLPNAESYRAVAVVQDNGAVSSLAVRYTLPDTDGDGERERVFYSVSYEFSSVEISPPDWLSEAKNETE